MKNIICVAGFGDNASMFDRLTDISQSNSICFLPINLPGFGSDTFSSGTTTLDRLADIVCDEAKNSNTDAILAHSVASIIASKAAAKENSPIKTILSLEGNLTAEDAYFSGTAAKFDSPEDFRKSFLHRLDDMARGDSIIERYRRAVEISDPQALWELGCDTNRFSSTHVPGDLLMQSSHSVYFYNPKNLPSVSRDWLDKEKLCRIELPNTSYWASVDRPDLLVEKVAGAMALIEP